MTLVKVLVAVENREGRGTVFGECFDKPYFLSEWKMLGGFQMFHVLNHTYLIGAAPIC